MALVAMLASQEQEVAAVQLQVEFVDDIVRMLAESDKKDEAEAKKNGKTVEQMTLEVEEAENDGEAAPKPKEEQKPVEKKVEDKKKKPAAKKEKEQKEDDMPMDAEAIKAYSSVIADAAEDSEPSKPVVYAEIKEEESVSHRRATAPPRS